MVHEQIDKKMPLKYERFELSPNWALPAYLWLNTNHLRNFNLSQYKSCKEIINEQDKEIFE